MKTILEVLQNLGPDWTAFILSMQVALVMGFLEYSKKIKGIALAS